MQLDKLVRFHKAVGDATRMRIIAVLKKGPLHGQAIAHKLGLKPPTITHHMTKLREVGIVYQRRDGNTIYFYLDEPRLTKLANSILQLGQESVHPSADLEAEEKLKIVKNFFSLDGKLTQLPALEKKRVIILAYMIQHLKRHHIYEEQELNSYIKKYCEDYATIRREWIMHHFIYRDGNTYQLNPEEMWPASF
ncbi:ArsR family transcriptional regulator [Terribacillus saccharophilus]|uniref:ArsR family transcriptional regulator n=1 Tax=Terribacillus saccharophilus TaxID=361277 RepID=A0A268HAU3_9BACI|nr:metalloregulator ArsR/SmtB family transcription factor [Terribacillus saccharophilus]PAE06993.1 ArsR family transcriptional regulator [Terribacillus saccharophilus]